MNNEVLEVCNRIIDKMREYTEERRSMNRLTCLEHDSRQSCLAMEADESASPKTRERTEGASTKVQVEHGDS